MTERKSHESGFRVVGQSSITDTSACSGSIFSFGPGSLSMMMLLWFAVTSLLGGQRYKPAPFDSPIRYTRNSLGFIFTLMIRRVSFPAFLPRRTFNTPLIAFTPLCQTLGSMFENVEFA